MTLASAKARTGMQNAPERAAVPGRRLSKKAEKEKTKITLSRTIAAGSEAIKITNTPSIYDTLGMTEEELEAIKADLQQ